MQAQSVSNRCQGWGVRRLCCRPPPQASQTLAFSACAQRHCGIIRFGQTNSGAFVERPYKAFRCAVALTILLAMLKQSGKNILPRSTKAFRTASATNRSLHSFCNFSTTSRHTLFCAQFFIRAAGSCLRLRSGLGSETKLRVTNERIKAYQ